MRRRNPNLQSDAPGQDSFLDVVANLVGILIILIMVIGAGTRRAMVEAAPADVAEMATEETPMDVAAPQAAAAALESSMHEISSRMKRQELEIVYRRTERDKILTTITAIERALEQHRDQLSSDEQQRFDLQRQLAEAQSALQEIERQRIALESARSTPGILEHLPTPLAKTVFGREVHFRLQGGRLAYVPWDELVEKLKSEAPQKTWKLKDAPLISETLGPVEGFRMDYTLRRVQDTVPTRVGMAVRERVELQEFVLVPVEQRLGEPIEQALGDSSRMRQILTRYNPDQTTVTVWVYPDSFEHFRGLKEALFRSGFLTAARPLPDGQPIGGSPQGTRSAAQ